MKNPDKDMPISEREILNSRMEDLTFSYAEQAGIKNADVEIKENRDYMDGNTDEFDKYYRPDINSESGTFRSAFDSKRAFKSKASKSFLWAGDEDSKGESSIIKTKGKNRSIKYKSIIGKKQIKQKIDNVGIKENNRNEIKGSIGKEASDKFDNLVKKEMNMIGTAVGKKTVKETTKFTEKIVKTVVKTIAALAKTIISALGPIGCLIILFIILFVSIFSMFLQSYSYVQSASDITNPTTAIVEQLMSEMTEEEISKLPLLVQVAYNELGNYQSKYQEWYGINDAWCCMFASYCLDQCGYIDNGAATLTASCTIMKNYLNNRGCYLSASGSVTPMAGYLIFFRWDGNTDANVVNHIGIVVAVRDNYVYVIHGNYGRDEYTKLTAFNINASYIAGYGIVQNQNVSENDNADILVTTESNGYGIIDEEGNMNLPNDIPEDVFNNIPEDIP